MVCPGARGHCAGRRRADSSEYAAVASAWGGGGRCASPGGGTGGGAGESLWCEPARCVEPIPGVPACRAACGESVPIEHIAVEPVSDEHGRRQPVPGEFDGGEPVPVEPVSLDRLRLQSLRNPGADGRRLWRHDAAIRRLQPARAGWRVRRWWLWRRIGAARWLRCHWRPPAHWRVPPRVARATALAAHRASRPEPC